MGSYFEFKPGLTPEGYAQEFRHKFNVGLEPINLDKICEELKISVFDEDLGNSGNIAGCIIWEDNEVAIVINKHIPYWGRKRFTIGHELGHFYFHEKLTFILDFGIIKSRSKTNGG